MPRDAKTPAHDSSYYFPASDADAMKLNAADRVAVESKLSLRLDLLIKVATVVAIMAPIVVAGYLGYTMPTRVGRLEQQVMGLARGQTILVALQCLKEPQPNIITIQLACDTVVKNVTIQQAGAPR